MPPFFVLRKIISWYSRLLRWLLALAVGILIFPVSLQIFSRYTELIPSYIWTEEICSDTGKIRIPTARVSSQRSSRLYRKLSF